MTYGLLELGQIKCAYVDDDKLNFLREGFKGRSPRYYDKGRETLR